MSRSWHVPGSLSSELHTTYFCGALLGSMKLHFMPVGKPAPPGGFHFLDDLLGRGLLAQDALPRFVAADLAVVLDLPGALHAERLEADLIARILFHCGGLFVPIEDLIDLFGREIFVVDVVD